MTKRARPLVITALAGVVLLAVGLIFAVDAPAPDPAKTPPVVITRTPDNGGAVLANPPLPNVLDKSIMAPVPAVRQAAMPFLKLTIPDPDDRANRPTVPPTRDAMPPIPTAVPGKPGL